MFISIVIPVFNEEQHIQPLYNTLVTEERTDKEYEYIFVDDGSKDNTLIQIKALKQMDVKVKYISFSRNFGHQNALMAGIDAAKGDCIITLDGDMQHPTSVINELINKWNEGFDVVNTIRIDENTGLFKNLTSKIFYKVMNFCSSIKVIEASSDFRLIDRKVAEELKKLKETHIFIRGMISWLGFNQTSISYKPSERMFGKSKYSLGKMTRFAFNGLTSFSVNPLRLFIVLGFVCSSLAFLYLTYAVISHFTKNATQWGWTSVIASILFIGGLNFIFLGIIAEYIGRIFIQSKQRPLYVVKEDNLS